MLINLYAPSEDQRAMLILVWLKLGPNPMTIEGAQSPTKFSGWGSGSQVDISIYPSICKLFRCSFI